MTPTKQLHYTITIDAPRQRVWKTMLEPESYQQWVNVSWPGSRYVGEWKKDASIRFLGGGDSQGGTLATLDELKPNERVSARHVAVINADGTEDRDSEMAQGWIGSTESYTFAEQGGKTRLDVDIATAPQWESMFNDGWPAALDKLKELCER
jgi:uncharacterized protein YndB with AHSA1/START domain